MNILDLYREDVDGKILSVSGGQEYRGPCPVCGGDDRFGVWPEQSRNGSFYCGRGSAGGNGCEIGGDAISYLRVVRKYSFHEACDCLGIEPKRGGESLKLRTPTIPKKYKEPVFKPQELSYPEDVVDSDKWHEHGMKFVNACHEHLLTRSTAIAYLMARGISKEMIVKHKLGFHLGETRKDKEYQPSFRPWPSWGLKEEKKGKRFRMIILPAGLVIPYIVEGRLHRITIRLVRKDPQQPKKRYHYVRGFIRDLWLSNPNAKAFVVQEAELDCIAVESAIGDLVGTIGIGSTGIKPDSRSAASLKNSIAILDCLDYDKAGKEAGKWWRSHYSQCSRWPVPRGKDAGEAFEAGVDLRDWILGGLPPIFHEVTADKKVAVQEEAAPTIPAHIPEQKKADGDDVQELKKLLTDAEGFFRIYDHGNAVGTEISPLWSDKYPEKRRRVTDLLFKSDAVGNMICNMSDGLYGPGHIPG